MKIGMVLQTKLCPRKYFEVPTSAPSHSRGQWLLMLLLTQEGN